MPATCVAHSEPSIGLPTLPAPHGAIDLVERLRRLPGVWPLSRHAEEMAALASEAAAEIERLRRVATSEVDRPGSPYIDWQSEGIVRDGMRVHLTRQEWTIFSCLAKSVGKMVTKEILHEHLYFGDPSGGASLDVIDVHICHLRKKSPWPITTIRGRGYAIEGCRHEKPTIPLPKTVPGITRERLMAGR